MTARVVRKNTNVSLSVDLRERVKQAPLNVSGAGGRNIRDEAQAVKAAQCAEWNDAMIKAYNAMVERDGLPLEDLRLF